jgi:hypothetical protein
MKGEQEMQTAALPEPKRAAERWLPLAEALRTLANNPQTAYMPRTAIRRAVERGDIPHQRSSDQKGARYYVRLSDITRRFRR